MKQKSLGKTGRFRNASRYQRTRQDHQTERAEDYVEIIAQLTAESGEARVVEIARELGVSHVTVNRAIHRLREGGLVTAEPYRAVYLTPAGRALAESCRERHQTVLRFLKALGVPDQTAALDAEGIEHHVSNETLAAFSRFLARCGKREGKS